MNVNHKMFQIVQLLQILLYVKHIIVYGQIKHVHLVHVQMYKLKINVLILVQELQIVNLYVYGKIILVYLHQIHHHFHQKIVILIQVVHMHGLMMHALNVKEKIILFYSFIL